MNLQLISIRWSGLVHSGCMMAIACARSLLGTEPRPLWWFRVWSGSTRAYVNMSPVTEDTEMFHLQLFEGAVFNFYFWKPRANYVNDYWNTFVDSDMGHFKVQVRHMPVGTCGMVVQDGFGDSCVDDALFCDITSYIDWRHGRRTAHTRMRLIANHTRYDQMEFARSCLLAAGMTWANFYSPLDYTCWRRGRCVMTYSGYRTSYLFVVEEQYLLPRPPAGFQSIKYHVIGARFCVLLWYLWTNLWNGVVFVLDTGCVVMRWTLLPGHYILLMEDSCNRNWNGETYKASSTENITAARQKLSTVVGFLKIIFEAINYRLQSYIRYIWNK